ncbi:hypothetical protein [Pseudonocardia sp. ICBG1142]|uniref:hypothetical protein n=1 Tax=Pseudonocardia sp. ICBG1142 TaxID=2846760 RepID=UPI001CF60DD2|nr:hypothetical protein [Pseudonocardia sp. ICBG1142]
MAPSAAFPEGADGAPRVARVGGTEAAGAEPTAEPAGAAELVVSSAPRTRVSLAVVPAPAAQDDDRRAESTGLPELPDGLDIGSASTPGAAGSAGCGATPDTTGALAAGRGAPSVIRSTPPV